MITKPWFFLATFVFFATAASAQNPKDEECKEKARKYASEASFNDCETGTYIMKPDLLTMGKEMYACFKTLTRKDIIETMGKPHFIHPSSGDFFYCISPCACNFSARRTDTTITAIHYSVNPESLCWYLIVSFSIDDKFKGVAYAN